MIRKNYNIIKCKNCGKNKSYHNDDYNNICSECYYLLYKNIKLKESEKICSKCKKIKDKKEFGQCKTTKDNLQYYCRDCQLLSRKVKNSKYNFRCTKCLKIKTIDNYYKKRDGTVFPECKECLSMFVNDKKVRSSNNYSHYKNYWDTKI